jgi:hypothetical protein
MISIAGLFCATALNCTHVGAIEMPFRYVGRRYDQARACYIRGQFFRRCPRVHPVYEEHPIVVRSSPILYQRPHYIHPYYR